MGTTAAKPRLSSRTNLADVLIDIIVVVNRDGTLVKSRHSDADSWYNMVYAIKNDPELGRMAGGYARLFDKVRFSWDGETPTSTEVSGILSGFGFIATDIGMLCEKGWLVKREVAERVELELRDMPESYRKFVDAAAEIARERISQGNIIDLLPVRLRQEMDTPALL